MASNNGNGSTGSLADGALPAERQLARSVKRGDQPGVLHIYLHHSGYRYNTLPPQLPLDDGMVLWHGRYRPKMDILLGAVHHSAMWAAAINVAIKKKTSLAWEMESDVALRAKRARRWLLNMGAGNGMFGYVPALSAGLRSYYGTAYQFIEIERAAPAVGSAVAAIHHLNPKKCFLTGNARQPVEYMSDDGEIRPLWWHDVIVITDLLSPVDDEGSIVLSATERAYPRIIVDEGIEQYIYQKVTARRPSAIHFVGGTMGAALDDSMDRAEEEANQKGYTQFMGSVFVEVFGDVPLKIESVPLYDIPEKTDIARERERSDLIYALNLDIDPQELNPALIGRQGLGSTGNQSLVLAQKARGYKSWEQQFTHALDELALDDKTMFSFREIDLNEKKLEAEIRDTAVASESAMIQVGIISPDEARNDLVDAGHLPPEYLKEDITAGVVVTDTEMPAGAGEGADDREDAEAAVPNDEEMETADKAYWAAVAAWGDR